MATMGMFACFLFNSISFAAVIISLFFIKPMETHKQDKKELKIWKNVMEGLRYIRSNKTISKTLVSIFTINGFAMTTNVLLTAFAKYVLVKGGSDYEYLYNYLIMIMGAGSFVGAMMIASMSRNGPHKVILQYYPFIIAGLLFAMAFANSFLAMAVGIAVLGFCFVSFTSTANSTVQYSTQDQYRGRVMSVFTLLSAGASPIGNLYAGFLTQNYGVRVGYQGNGLLIFALLIISRLLSVRRKGKKDGGDTPALPDAGEQGAQ